MSLLLGRNVKQITRKLSRKVRTSGCAVGTIYGDIMDGLQDIELPPSKMKVSHLYDLSKKIIEFLPCILRLEQFTELFFAKMMFH